MTKEKQTSFNDPPVTTPNSPRSQQEKKTTQSTGNASQAPAKKTDEEVEKAIEKTNLALYTDFPGINAQKMNIIRNTICKGLDFLEACLFLNHCHGIGLNPFNKEVWAWKDRRGKIVSTVSEAGYRVNAERHGDYGGIRFGVIYEGDEFEIDYVAGEVVHKRKGLIKGLPVGAWAQSLRKDKPTLVVQVDFKEYAKPYDDSAWKNNPSDMIAKVARTKVLSVQFPVSGSVPEFEVTTRDGMTDYVDHTKPIENEEDLAKELLESKLAEALELWTIYEGIDKQRIGETIRHLQDKGTLTVETLNEYIDAMSTKK